MQSRLYLRLSRSPQAIPQASLPTGRHQRILRYTAFLTNSIHRSTRLRTSFKHYSTIPQAPRKTDRLPRQSPRSPGFSSFHALISIATVAPLSRHHCSSTNIPNQPSSIAFHTTHVPRFFYTSSLTATSPVPRITSVAFLSISHTHHPSTTSSNRHTAAPISAALITLSATIPAAIHTSFSAFANLVATSDPLAINDASSSTATHLQGRHTPPKNTTGIVIHSRSVPRSGVKLFRKSLSALGFLEQPRHSVVKSR